MDIIKKQITFNRSVRTAQIEYIVIHDTGNVNHGANAQAHFDYFNQGDRQASADFFVDSDTILQVNDYKTYYTWHCGDGKGKYGITNHNSIGIEICVNKDGSYERAVNHAIALTRHLMNLLNINISHVVRHYDASRKNCPASMRFNDWERWTGFINAVAGKGEIEDEGDMIYNYIDKNMPDWAAPTIQKLVDKGFLKGNENGELGLNDVMLKIFVVNDRAGLYGK